MSTILMETPPRQAGAHGAVLPEALRALARRFGSRGSGSVQREGGDAIHFVQFFMRSEGGFAPCRPLEVPDRATALACIESLPRSVALAVAFSVPERGSAARTVLGRHRRAE